MRDLTQDRAKELFDYNSNTGDLIRILKTGSRTRLGPITGKHTGGYLQLTHNGHRYLVHRVVWLWVHGVWPTEIDHINHDRADNRLENLRETTSTGNHRNQSLRSCNTSGFNGVCWHKANNRWAAAIKINGRKINLGWFHDKEDAISARKTANIQYGFHPNHGAVG